MKTNYQYKFNDGRILEFENEEIRDIYIKIHEKWGVFLSEDPCDGEFIKSHQNGKYIGDLLISMGFSQDVFFANRGKKFHRFTKGCHTFSHRDLLDLYEQIGEMKEYVPVCYSKLDTND